MTQEVTETYIAPPLMRGSPVFHKTRSDWGLGVIQSGPSETGDWNVQFWDAPIAAGIRPENLVHYADLRHKRALTAAQSEADDLRAEVAGRDALLNKAIALLDEISTDWRTRQSDNYLHRLDDFLRQHDTRQALAGQP